VTDHPATPQGEELVEAAITQDSEREAINGHTAEVEASSGWNEEVRERIASILEY
jgi:hypothetical protein